MVYAIMPTNMDIQHHGVLGMKWGIRRYQPYSVKPRGSGEGGKEIGEAAKADRKAAKSNVKAAYKNAKKVAGYINRYEEAGRQYNDTYNSIRSNKNLSDEQKDMQIAKLESKYANGKAEKMKAKYDKYKSIMDEAVKQTLDAESIIGEKKVEQMLKNRTVRDAVIGGAVGGLAYGLLNGTLGLTTGYINVNPLMPAAAIGAGANIGSHGGRSLIDARQKAKGKQTIYESAKSSINKEIEGVKNNIDTKKIDNTIKKVNKTVDKTLNKSSSGTQKLSKPNQERYNRAKNLDKWDIDFMESIQNSKIFNDNNKSEILKEYKKYLLDTDNYIRNNARKLKMA